MHFQIKPEKILGTFEWKINIISLAIHILSSKNLYFYINKSQPTKNTNIHIIRELLLTQNYQLLTQNHQHCNRSGANTICNFRHCFQVILHLTIKTNLSVSKLHKVREQFTIELLFSSYHVIWRWKGKPSSFKFLLLSRLKQHSKK